MTKIATTKTKTEEDMLFQFGSVTNIDSLFVDHEHSAQNTYTSHVRYKDIEAYVMRIDKHINSIIKLLKLQFGDPYCVIIMEYYGIKPIPNINKQLSDIWNKYQPHFNKYFSDNNSKCIDLNSAYKKFCIKNKFVTNMDKNSIKWKKALNKVRMNTTSIYSEYVGCCCKYYGYNECNGHTFIDILPRRNKQKWLIETKQADTGLGWGGDYHHIIVTCYFDKNGILNLDFKAYHAGKSYQR